MILVEVKAVTERKIESIKITGHANSAPYGQDLVCAGVSAIVTGGLNALEDIDSFNIVHDPGNVVIERKKDKSITEHDSVVLNTIMTQLETIEETYKKYIEIKTYL